MLKFVVTTGTLHLHLPPQSSSPCSCSCSCSCSVVSSSFGHHRNRSRRIRRHHKKLKQSGPVTTTTTTTTTTTSFEPKLETVIDLTHLTLFRSNIRRLVSSGRDAYHDLETLFTLDDNRRLLVSCRPSTLQFVGASAAFTFIVFSFFRVLVLFVSSSSSRFWWSLRQNNNNRPMVRRDRSLGGKEVVIGLGPTRNNNNTTTALNLLIPAHRSSSNNNNNKATIVQKKLPQWWPLIMVNANANATDLDLDLDDYKRESSRVVRAIVDSRMAGQDISEHHIIQLRQLCRTSGVQVSVELTNIRDSLYRASVNFVLDACSSAPTYSTSVHFNGEDARQFLAGFAENIGLENVRAATIVSAAVAARTRSCLLQAWALEMQGKHVQTLAELSKICLLLQIFPPEESSPEMEMVSRGLEKHLKLEQRKHLMFLFTKVCSEDSHRIAKEALGLMHSQNCWADQFEDNIAP